MSHPAPTLAVNTLPLESEKPEAKIAAPPPTVFAPPADPPAFGDEAELPPTWTEGSLIFHTTGKCTRLQAIGRNRRISGKPGVAMRPCFNCEDIFHTRRTG